MKQKNLNTVKGFTLVELLVVVAIIAILSTIGLTIFTSAQANARDARRKADIDAIANAIETSRAPGTLYYIPLATTQFSGGTIPADSARLYCIKTAIDGIVPGNPAAVWTTVCPTNWGTVGTGSIANSTSVTAWKVCASLENNTVYCKPSSQ